MGLFDAFSYAGKRALVVGGATGMGAAAAEVVKDAGAEVVVMDRAEVILDIFATRARSKEARMQVELAQLEYMLPRLTRMWSHLEKMRNASQRKG